MEHSACRVIYIDERFGTERWIQRDGGSPGVNRTSTEFSEEPDELITNVKAILRVFTKVLACNSGRSFSVRLAELNEDVKAEHTPIIALFDIGSEIRNDHLRIHKTRTSTSLNSSPQPLHRAITFSSESDESYGLQLLSRIASDLQVQERSNLIIPVAVVRRRDLDASRRGSIEAHVIEHGSGGKDDLREIDPQKMLRCLDAGAVDVLPSPMDQVRIMGLTVHAYRVYKTAKQEDSSFLAHARSRRQSWVGVDDAQPYGYLREAMVKKLMKGICNPEETIEDYQHRDLSLAEHRKTTIAEEVGKWSFCGHDFDEDELVYASFCMLEHALQMPELAKWRMSSADILSFVQSSRVAYNSFVLYHNFRHAVDVLQSLFYFLVQIGVLPEYRIGQPVQPVQSARSPIASLLKPFDGLTLLVSAIGHDVGHPGVNNMFLVKLNAPLAQLYNDQSVLEAFHCAAYSQILRRHWPAAFEDKALRKLLISSILATDMGIHYDYMQQLGNLQEKIHESKVTDGWAPKDIEINKVLACGLLIKCADISNVARPWPIAERWTYLLQDEFAHQGVMERQIGMETTLFGGPPEIGNTLKLANGQIGFMTIFAHPLFEAVAGIMPAMQFAADEISKNKHIWTIKAEQEKRRELIRQETAPLSPRSLSPAAPWKRSAQNNASETGQGPATEYFPSSPLRATADKVPDRESSKNSNAQAVFLNRQSPRTSLANINNPSSPSPDRASRRSSGGFSASNLESKRDESRSRKVALRTNSSENEPPKLKGASETSDYMPPAPPDYSRSSKQDPSPNSNSFFSPPQQDYHNTVAYPWAKNGFKEFRPQDPTVSAPPPNPPGNFSQILKSASTSLSRSSQDSPPMKTFDGGSIYHNGDRDPREPRDRDARSSDQRSTTNSASASACLPSVLSLSNSDSGSKSMTSSVRVDVTPGSNGVGGNGVNIGSNGTNGKSVPRRRSRLRLAFWKKNRAPAAVDVDGGEVAD